MIPAWTRERKREGLKVRGGYEGWRVVEGRMADRGITAFRQLGLLVAEVLPSTPQTLRPFNPCSVEDNKQLFGIANNTIER